MKFKQWTIDRVSAECLAEASDLHDIWAGDIEQIDAHLESANFPQHEIDLVINDLCDLVA